MKNLLKKLTSRKFWLAAAGVVTGIAMAFGVDEGAVSTLAGAITAVTSAVAYIITEGHVDAAGVQAVTESARLALDAVQAESGTVQ